MISLMKRDAASFLGPTSRSNRSPISSLSDSKDGLHMPNPIVMKAHEEMAIYWQQKSHASAIMARHYRAAGALALATHAQRYAAYEASQARLRLANAMEAYDAHQRTLRSDA